MENNELALNLIKKLESGEAYFETNGYEYFLYFKGIDKPIKIGELLLETKNYNGYEGDDWNKEFKENFYKEKGLINCWYKDCPNKIYQTEHDYKKVKIKCEEKHTRLICQNHYQET